MSLCGADRAAPIGNALTFVDHVHGHSEKAESDPLDLGESDPEDLGEVDHEGLAEDLPKLLCTCT